MPQEVFRGNDVLTFRAPSGGRAANLTLRVHDGDLQIRRGNRVLASQEVANTKIVVLHGTSRRDRIVIDKSVAKEFAGSIEVHGGAKFDWLVVERPRHSSAFEVNPHEIQVNQLSVVHGNFERVRVRRWGRLGIAVLLLRRQNAVKDAGGFPRHPRALMRRPLN